MICYLNLKIHNVIKTIKKKKIIILYSTIEFELIAGGQKIQKEKFWNTFIPIDRGFAL